MSEGGKGSSSHSAVPTPAHGSKQQREGAGRSAPQQTAEEKKGEIEEREDPNEYADPICVCEPEPYWQEIAEQLQREHQREN